jgi:hypothetical protein
VSTPEPPEPAPASPPPSQQPARKVKHPILLSITGGAASIVGMFSILTIVGLLTVGFGGNDKRAAVSRSTSPAPTSTEQPARSEQPTPTTTQPPPTTTTTTTTTPTTTEPPQPVVHEGKGDDVIPLAKPPGVTGAAIVTFECPKCAGNTVVKSDGAESLLVNTIGPYHGARWIDVRDHSKTSQLTITAKGTWKITVSGIDQARRANGSEPVQGDGDDVFVLDGKSKSAAITNKGKSNFAVHVVSNSSLRLAVNEIGGYAGTVPLAAPALVQVTSSGMWTITPGP